MLLARLPAAVLAGLLIVWIAGDGYAAPAEPVIPLCGTDSSTPCGTAANPLITSAAAGGGTQDVNLEQVNGAAVQTGAGTAAGTIRVELPTDGTGKVNAAQSGTWTVQPGNTANTTPWLTTPVPGASGSCTPYHLAGGTAASTNSTNIKASAGTLCHLTAINTTVTTYYLRMYNLAAAPTCSSATGAVHTYPVLPSGGINIPLPVGETYSAGIGFCVTGGGSDTDNTNAATGVYIEASYR